MSGVRLQLVPKRFYDFGTLQLSQAQTLFVVERIDVSQYIDAVLVLRTHAVNLTGGTIQVFLSADGFTEDDPDLVFVPTTPLISLNVTSPAPQLSTQLATVRGHYAVLGIVGQRTSNFALNATVSMDLILRNPDSAARPAGLNGAGRGRAPVRAPVPRNPNQLGLSPGTMNGGAKKNGCDCPGNTGAPCDCKKGASTAA
jgi:hypothetical protein